MVVDQTFDANQAFNDVVNNPGSALSDTTHAYSEVGFALGQWIAMILIFSVLVLFIIGYVKGAFTKHK